MADDPDSDKKVDAGSGAALAPALTAEQREALLERAVFDQTREARATVESRGEFEATVLRSSPVRHGFHFKVVVALTVMAVVVSQLFGTGLWGLEAALVVPGLYMMWWAFLAMTAANELQHLSVDERGTITSARSGMSLETRGDILRVAIPVIVIIVCSGLTVGLIHDIAYPPPPNCNVPVTDQPDSCLSLSFMGSAVVGQYVPTPTPAPSATPAPSSSPAARPTAKPAGGETKGFSVSQTIALERLVRGFQLVIAVAILLAAIWFLRRMLTGKWVAYIRPVRHRLEDE
jgi:hypothetical protein